VASNTAKHEKKRFGWRIGEILYDDVIKAVPAENKAAF
jgi:hypothetical protein